MNYDIFKYKKINKKNLLKYGFTLHNNTFGYTAPIMNGDFNLNIQVKAPNIVGTLLTEAETEEPYTLHLTSETGTFVGKVREEYEKILYDIAEKCFENDVFKTKQAKDIISYISDKYGGELEFLWEKTPDCAIARRLESKKWYIIFMVVKKDRFGFESGEEVEVINLHCPVGDVPELLQSRGIYPAYHMNKKHWISIILDETVPVVEIYKLLDKSYELAKK